MSNKLAFSLKITLFKAQRTIFKPLANLIRQNMKRILFIGFVISIASCNYLTIKSEVDKHEKLISFKSVLVMDMGEYLDLDEQERQRIYDNTRFYPETDTIAYLNDTLYISYLTYVNSCAIYDGNIEIRNDTIFLEANNIGEHVCMSGRLDRFIYVIFNPDNIEYTIIQD